MTKHLEDTSPTSPCSETRSTRRRPYRKPRIVHQEALEAVAADCSVVGGKGDPTCIVGFS